MMFLRQRHWPDLSWHNMSTAPPWSHWQPAKDSKSHLKINSPTDWNHFIAEHAVEEFIARLKYFTAQGIIRREPREYKHVSAMRSHVILSYANSSMSHLGSQSNSSSEAGSIRLCRCCMNVRARLSCSNSAHFPDAHKKKGFSQTGVAVDSLMKMCLSLPGSHLLALSNTTQGAFHITATVWNEGGGLSRKRQSRVWVNRLWLQHFVTFTDETSLCKTPPNSALVRHIKHAAKVCYKMFAFNTRSQRKKKKNILKLREARFFRQRGSDITANWAKV